jgi:hypothetical protein
MKYLTQCLFWFARPCVHFLNACLFTKNQYCTHWREERCSSFSPLWSFRCWQRCVSYQTKQKYTSSLYTCSLTDLLTSFLSDSIESNIERLLIFCLSLLVCTVCILFFFDGGSIVKGTLLKLLDKDFPGAFSKCVSHTTRKPRTVSDTEIDLSAFN